MTEIIEFAPTGYEEAAAKERSLSPGRRRQRARRELKREYLGHVSAHPIYYPPGDNMTPITHADLERLAGGSNLERTFETIWRQLGGPELEREYRFHPKRKWRADFAHPRALVLIEIEGGTWTHGRHNRAQGYQADVEKYNAATLMGWSVFRLTRDMLTPAHIEPIIAYTRETLELNR